MRTVLVTGPGGAGRTTVAAATALASARDGARTLLISADPIPGFPDATGPTPVTGGLWSVRIDSGAHFRDELLALQQQLSGVLDLLGGNPLDGEELTELPGSAELALLHALRRAAHGDWADGAYDLLVVDLPPLREALALLALPEQLRRYLRRLLPQERQAARALRPMLAQLAGVPMPAQWLYEAAARRDAELAQSRRSSRTAPPRSGWSPNRDRPPTTPCAPPAPDSPCTACAPGPRWPTGCSPATRRTPSSPRSPPSRRRPSPTGTRRGRPGPRRAPRP